MSRKNKKNVEKNKISGRVLLMILMLVLAGVPFLFMKEEARAASASISVQSKENTLTKGDTFFVLVTVSSMDEIYGFEGYFRYDSRYLKFVSGGKLVHGNDDAFHIQDVERLTGRNSEGRGQIYMLNHA